MRLAYFANDFGGYSKYIFYIIELLIYLIYKLSVILGLHKVFVYKKSHETIPMTKIRKLYTKNTTYRTFSLKIALHKNVTVLCIFYISPANSIKAINYLLRRNLLLYYFIELTSIILLLNFAPLSQLSTCCFKL